MQSKGFLYRRVLHDSFLTHPHPTRTAFLCGLETQLHGSGKFRLPLLENPGCSQQHCGMAVVTAGVHFAGVTAFEINIRFFFNR